MNGAGNGGRFVTRRNANGTVTPGKTQIGNRAMRQADFDSVFRSREYMNQRKRLGITAAGGR